MANVQSRFAQSDAYLSELIREVRQKLRQRALLRRTDAGRHLAMSDLAIHDG